MLAWVFMILMFVKVEQQCWQANKLTRGINVTRYVHVISLSDDLVKWLHCNIIGHGHCNLSSIWYLRNDHGRVLFAILAIFSRITNDDCLSRSVESRISVVQVRRCIRAVLYIVNKVQNLRTLVAPSALMHYSLRPLGL